MHVSMSCMLLCMILYDDCISMYLVGLSLGTFISYRNIRRDGQPTPYSLYWEISSLPI